jgi:hypothetical protein
MKSILLTLFSLLISVGSAVMAGEPAVAPCFPTQANLCCTCPDDYCPKPLPMTPCPQRCWCDGHYCPKPLPVVCFKTPDCIDDYCKKPFPKIFKCCPPPAAHH